MAPRKYFRTPPSGKPRNTSPGGSVDRLTLRKSHLSEIPNPRLQIPSKTQIPNLKRQPFNASTVHNAQTRPFRLIDPPFGNPKSQAPNPKQNPKSQTSNANPPTIQRFNDLTI